MDTPELLKLRILISFVASGEENSTVTGIARALREEKQKISRAMIGMEKEGLVDRSNTRAPVLTEKGLAVAKHFAERIEIAQNHLLYEGMELEPARQDSYIWALYCSDELMDVIRDSDACYRVKNELREMKTFTGYDLCKRLADGCYQFPFIIYREHVKNGKNISMANDGFAHPCDLYVENGVGTVQLLVQSTSQKSGRDGHLMRGKVDRLSYFCSGRFISAEISSNVVSFPADALAFVNMGRDTGNVLHGSVCLKMRCSCGLVHMPESTAIFTMLI